MSRRPNVAAVDGAKSRQGLPNKRPRSGAGKVRQTVISRRALVGRSWQPTSLFAAAAVSRVAADRQHRRTAPQAASPEPRLIGLVTPVEAAKLLGVGRTTIYRLAKEHQLTRIRIGRCARFSRIELEEFVERLQQEARRQSSG